MESGATVALTNRDDDVRPGRDALGDRPDGRTPSGHRRGAVAIAPIILERWHLGAGCEQSEGCRYLARVGVFHRGMGPSPPLHPQCHCVRRPFVAHGMSEEAFLALVRQADNNGAWVDMILARAERQRARG